MSRARPFSRSAGGVPRGAAASPVQPELAIATHCHAAGDAEGAERACHAALRKAPRDRALH
jgi:hypothetical protein